MALPKLPQLGLDETGQDMNDPRIIVALDYAEAGPALEFARQVKPELCRLKVGKELFTAAGPELVRQLVDRGFDVFLDLKFHDIPNTVNKACAAAARLGIWMLNVHALGGDSMMRAAREGVEKVSRPPLLVGVTVLTSLDEDQLHTIGIDRSLPEMVERLASASIAAGLDGVVCSARECAALRARIGEQALLVTPGIRPDWAERNDQQRIVTPEQALADGASYLVIGRPITSHPDPSSALLSIARAIGAAA